MQLLARICIPAFFLLIQAVSVPAFEDTPDYTNHPCNRACNNSTKPMVCAYDWKIEWYSVLSKACLDCPFNLTSCANKDCVPTNGFVRAIITVNRMLPGPAISVCQGDTIKVYLYNNLHMTEGTSFHWYYKYE